MDRSTFGRVVHRPVAHLVSPIARARLTYLNAFLPAADREANRKALGGPVCVELITELPG